MSAMTLFGKPSNVASKFSGVQSNLTSSLSGGASGNRRISIKGGVFREIIGGKEVRVNEERSMNVVIINAAPVSRMYFEGKYVEGEAVKPMCWSHDCNKPAPEVPEAQRQASNCRQCKQDIKGSGPSDSRACKFQQRVAVMVEGEITKRQVYQLALPSTSVFGDAENGKMPLQAYARHCGAHSTLVESIITEMRFDTSSPTPKLVFKPVRELTEEEADAVLEMREAPETIRAITLTVSQTDGVMPAPKLEAPAPKKVEPEPESVVEEPKKVAKKNAPAPVQESKADLADIVGDWDDE